MNKEYAIKIKELNEQMRSCEHVIKSKDAKNTEIILEVLLITLGILGGGLLVGAIFETVAKAMVISLAVNALVVFDRVTKISQNRATIKRNQLKVYEIEDKIRELSSKEYENIKDKSIIKEKVTNTKKGTKYSYNGNKGKETSKQKDIPIEFFDESDFNDEVENDNHKKR